METRATGMLEEFLGLEGVLVCNGLANDERDPRVSAGTRTRASQSKRPRRGRGFRQQTALPSTDDPVRTTQCGRQSAALWRTQGLHGRQEDCRTKSIKRYAAIARCVQDLNVVLHPNQLDQLTSPSISPWQFKSFSAKRSSRPANHSAQEARRSE